MSTQMTKTLALFSLFFDVDTKKFCGKKFCIQKVIFRFLCIAHQYWESGPGVYEK